MKEVRCIKCRNWFIKKQLNHKFCTKECREGYHERIYNLSFKRKLSSLKYYKAHREKRNEKAKAWYKLNRERAIKSALERYYKSKLRSFMRI